VEVVHVGMMETLALGVLALLIGNELNRRASFLKNICIPSPVTGGFVLSLLTLALHCCAGIDISFDATLKDVCMLLFFTTAGLQCDFRHLKTGGKPLAIITVLVAVLIVLQNLMSVGLCGIMGQNPLLGMTAGSVTMAGGHGTAGGFASVIEAKGLAGAAPISMAAATFGLIAGSVIGGPLGERLIEKFSLHPGRYSASVVTEIAPEKHMFDGNRMVAVCVICITAGAGSLLSKFITAVGLTVPTYFGALIAAIILRNFSELNGKCPKLPVEDIISVGKVCLALFLGMALVTLRLWELSDIALPLLAILLFQVLMMFLFARYVVFHFLGRNYDAAVLAGGFCGFGLGATPNALANMNAICLKNGYTPLPFILVPIVGAAFVDVINVSVITVFLNII